VPIVDHQDHVLPGERHHLASTQVLIEFHAVGERPRDQEILHHATVLELVLDRVRVIRPSLLEQSLKMVCRRPGLALAATYGGHDVPHTGAAHFLVIVVIIVDRSHNLLRTLLASLLAALGALLGIMDGDVE
jgi:hypothetical protein